MVDGQQICTNDSIFLEGAYQFTSGTYVDTLNSVAGCDSIVTTYLVVDNILYGNDTVSICFGDSILLGGAMQSIGGDYTDTISSNSGCDSVVSTHLEIKPITNSFDTLEICYGDSAFLGGAFQTSTGIYFNIYANSNGCDSIHQTYLSVRPQVVAYDTIEICSLDSVFLQEDIRTQVECIMIL